MRYIPTIGLEIHAELKTKSKMFCTCANDPLEQHPNINICPICMGHPGTLPTANEDAIRKVIKVGLSLNCEISLFSKFDRKNYFYPDLPKGYQISQYDLPFCKNGFLEIDGKKIRITRVHLEEDTGKLIHGFENTIKGPTPEQLKVINEGVNNPRFLQQGTQEKYSLIDFNRAGVPLMELVTEPDITNSKEASAFAKELQLILRYLDASNADMEKGQMRVEANVSVRPEDTEKLGTKVEVKNLNSFRVVAKSIDYEIQRQTEVLETNGKVSQETRGWNEKTEKTFIQREKESAHDYRYFPEPDIPPITFTAEDIEKIRFELPELPQARRTRFQKEFDLTEGEAVLFVDNKDIGEFYEKTISELGPHLEKEKRKALFKLSANYIASDLMGILEGASVAGEDFLITPENFSELILLIYEGKISSAIAKTVLKEMFATGADPDHIIADKGLSQISDEGKIKALAQDIILKNPKAVEDFKSGKENSLQFLVGQMMVATRGTVKPDRAREILLNLLTK